MGLRDRAPAGGCGPYRERVDDGFRALSGAAEGRCPQLGQRRLYLLAGRQPAGRAGSRQARLLVRLRGHGRLPSGRRCRQVSCRVDDPWRAGGRCLRHGCGALRAVRREQGIYQADDRPVLFAPLRHDLSERAASGRPAVEDGAGAFGHGRCRRGLGPELGSRGAALFRTAGIQRSSVAETLERL